MEVNIVLVIIGLVCLGVFIGPFILAQLAQNKKAKQASAKYFSRSRELGLQITDNDQWNLQYAIGLDSEQSKLFYTQVREPDSKELTIDLKKVQKCNIVNNNKVIRSGEGESKVFERLALQLKYKNSETPDQFLDFYRSDGGLTLNGELQLLNKWHDIILSRLKIK